ncbi:Anti-sigma regulatory factor (Ser/Thr protein kinase) [Saccharicrinis carchari]|uniref:Anti-sigma regulatory factor (Ser/Thr protein kinase) n=1 Tax=Saccharicrinis carchari TaxID=1168039 RepID=A0A521DT78_SACCC|nr:ATP-binding protein [Saccharicrinis carchari]SMO74919.1 Anti-sigma regulatory factor (Ser/Thr protein kinase) [Saccharicrinis carchari]
MKFVYEVEGGDFSKAGNAASGVKKVLKQLNVNPKVIKRTVVALYEAEVNIVAHAYKGTINININTADISIVLDDEGPGIPDIELAMREGFSTASSEVREMGFGAGMGLPNIKKNVDELKVSSIVNKGTKVEMKTNL